VRAGCGALLLSLLPFAPAWGQEPEWLAYDLADPAGRTVAQLQFGVAATQALTFAATCSEGQPDTAATFHVDTGVIPAGDPVTVVIEVSGRRETRPGAVVEDAFGTHAVARLTRDDPVWERLAAGLVASIGVEGAQPTGIHLRGSRVAITRFLASCANLAAMPAPPAPVASLPPPTPETEDSSAEPAAANDAARAEAADGAGAGTADAEPALPLPPAEAPAAPQPPWPLYVTGAEPVPAFSAMRFGIALDPLPPGTTVRRTGASGVRDSHEWVEVQTVDARARTVWVRRDQLEPSAAGAATYANPDPAAALLMRAEPSPQAPVVGSIPARAVGIADQGQRQGDWVLVSFGGITGWVSHLFLQPVGATLPAVTGAPEEAPAPAIATIEPYRAVHDAWTVDCDPCRRPAEGAACRITAPSGATAGRQATLAVEPDADGSTALGARYTARAALPAPADAILTLAVDTAPPVTVAGGGWRLDPASGDALIAAAAVEPMLPALRSGHTLTISVSDGARIWVDQFALAGFATAIADVASRLPMPSRSGNPYACPAPDEGATAAADGTAG
jgi:invasion protein IalB